MAQVVERFVRDEEAASSSLVTPMKRILIFRVLFSLFPSLRPCQKKFKKIEIRA